MTDGIAIGACSVAVVWIVYESVCRWLKGRADNRLWAAVQKSVPRDVWHPRKGVLTDEEEQKVARVFGAQDTTLPRAHTRKRKK